MENNKDVKSFIKNHIGFAGIILFVFASICFVIPSIIYMVQNHTVFRFNESYKFLLQDVNRFTQAILYLLVLTLLTIGYVLIVKYRKQIFKNIKSVLIFVAIVSLLFVFVLPFTSGDIFYYLGIGRINTSNYGQNPYYTTIKDFVDDGNEALLENDSVLKQGYEHYWGDTTVVYGPVWTLICRFVAFLSFGSVDFGLLLFKLFALLVHVLNCYLIYKITNRKMFALLYGLNPLLLLEGIVCVHNDIFVILFTLISLYFLLKKNSIALSVIFLAIATGIKYFKILLLPFIIIYHFRKEKPSKRLLKCIAYGALFALVLVLFYIIYIRDLEIFNGLFVQQGKYAKNFYIIILEYFTQPANLAGTVNKILLYSFIIIYFFTCVILLTKKKIKFRNEIRNYNYLLLAFLFLLITNFQVWYIMWLFPTFMFQKKNMTKLIIQISLIAEFATTLFIAYGEAWQYGTPFTFIMVTATLIAIIINNKKAILKA